MADRRRGSELLEAWVGTLENIPLLFRNTFRFFRTKQPVPTDVSTSALGTPFNRDIGGTPLIGEVVESKLVHNHLNERTLENVFLDKASVRTLHGGDLATDSYGHTGLDVTYDLVDENTPEDAGSSIRESVVTPIGNGKAIKVTKTHRERHAVLYGYEYDHEVKCGIDIYSQILANDTDAATLAAFKGMQTPNAGMQAEGWPNSNLFFEQQPLNDFETKLIGSYFANGIGPTDYSFDESVNFRVPPKLSYAAWVVMSSGEYVSGALAGYQMTAALHYELTGGGDGPWAGRTMRLFTRAPSGFAATTIKLPTVETRITARWWNASGSSLYPKIESYYIPEHSGNPQIITWGDTSFMGYCNFQTTGISTLGGGNLDGTSITLVSKPRAYRFDWWYVDVTTFTISS